MTNRLSIMEVEAEFLRIKGLNPRKALEYAYALAQLNRLGGNTDGVALYRQECLQLMNECDMVTAEDCVQQHIEIGGVGIPEYMTEAVVRERLGLPGA